MVGRPIALDAGEVAPRRIGIDNRQVDSERRHADLGDDLPALATKRVRNGFLKGAVVSAQAPGIGSCKCASTAVGKFEEVLEIADAQGLCACQVDLFGSQGAEDAKFMASPGDGDVEPTLTSRAIERAEVHGNVACSIGAVGDREVHNVALVTLNTFQVFHEYGFKLTLREVAFQRGVFSAFGVEQILDQLLLFAVECHDADGQLALSESRAA